MHFFVLLELVTRGVVSKYKGVQEVINMYIRVSQSIACGIAYVVHGI